jgi:hypothetical protein
MNAVGTLLPRANAAASAAGESGLASSPRRVREGQRIAAVARELDDLRRIEEAMVIAGAGERAPGAEIEAVLGCKVSRGVKAAA